VKNIDEKNKKLLREKGSAADTTAELQTSRNELKEKTIECVGLENSFNVKTKMLKKKQADITMTANDLE